MQLRPACPKFIDQFVYIEFTVINITDNDIICLGQELLFLFSLELCDFCRIWLVLKSRFILEHNSSPSIPGIITSDMTRSGIVSTHCCPEKFYHKVGCSTEPASGTLTGVVG